MKRRRDEVEAELLAEAKEVIDELLDWTEETEAPTLTQIEDTVLELRKRLGERMAELVVEEQEGYWLNASNAVSRSRMCASPSSTLPRTSFCGSSCGSCGR